MLDADKGPHTKYLTKYLGRSSSYVRFAVGFNLSALESVVAECCEARASTGLCPVSPFIGSV